MVVQTSIPAISDSVQDAAGREFRPSVNFHPYDHHATQPPTFSIVLREGREEFSRGEYEIEEIQDCFGNTVHKYSFPDGELRLFRIELREGARGIDVTWIENIQDQAIVKFMLLWEIQVKNLDYPVWGFPAYCG